MDDYYKNTAAILIEGRHKKAFFTVMKSIYIQFTMR